MVVVNTEVPAVFTLKPAGPYLIWYVSGVPVLVQFREAVVEVTAVAVGEVGAGQDTGTAGSMDTANTFNTDPVAEPPVLVTWTLEISLD